MFVSLLVIRGEFIGAKCTQSWVRELPLHESYIGVLYHDTGAYTRPKLALHLPSFFLIWGSIL